jgi:hypothetical protein
MTSRTKKKRVDFSVRPRAKESLPPDPDAWVREGQGAQVQPPKEQTGPQKRLTLNLPAAMHTAFKGRCVVEGVTIQDKVQELIRRELEQQAAATGQGTQPL